MEVTLFSGQRSPMFENEFTKAVGLMASCNCCDRIIFEDEDYREQYTDNGGYCKECQEEAETEAKQQIDVNMNTELYTAWSSDWSKKLTFTKDLINSPKWERFKLFCLFQLGESWGWELSTATLSDIDVIGHYTLDTFN